MPYAKHVASLMSHDTCSPPENVLIIRLIILLLKKPRIIPRERKNPSPLPNTSQTKHKIPLIFGIKISKSHSNKTESIRLQTFPQFIEYVPGIVLLLLCVFVDAMVDAFQDIALFQYLHFQWVEEALAECLQCFYEVRVDLFLEGFYVDYVSFLVDFVVELAFVRVVCLPLLLVIPQPISFFRLADWLEQRNHLLQAFFDPIRQTRETTYRNFPRLLIRHLKKFLHVQLSIYSTPI